jgi:hypothetical protein
MEGNELAMIDPELVRRVREGSYVIDPQAVAVAMVERRRDADVLSRVLVSAQRHRFAGGTDQDGAGPGADFP